MFKKRAVIEKIVMNNLYTNELILSIIKVAPFSIVIVKKLHAFFDMIVISDFTYENGKYSKWRSNDDK